MIYFNFTCNIQELLICTQNMHNIFNNPHKILKPFYFFISAPELKAQVSINDRLLSVCPFVRSFVRPSVCKLSTLPSSPEPLGQFQLNLAQSILGWREIQVSSNEGPCPFPRGDIYEITEIHWRILIKFSSPEQLGKFQPNIAQTIRGWRGLKVLQIRTIQFLMEIMIFSPSP